MKHASQSGRISRRTIVAGAGVAGLAGVGTALYRTAPSFWKQYARDWKRSVLPPPARPKPADWPDTGIHAAWLGHATVLLKVDGFTILTDPMFSTRAGLNLGLFTLGVKRLVEPALAIRELPPIDLILLSHAHMDHLDIPSLKGLENRATTVVTAMATSDLFRADRYKETRELGWEERTRVGLATLKAFRVNHWGARMRSDTYRGYNAYVIEAGRYRILFGGDTAATDAFRALRASKPFDLAIMPIGTYDPWVRYHCTPEQAWRMGNDARTEFFLPVHHQTFPLSREPLLEPLERFYGAAGNQPDRVAISRIGDQWRIS
jgi:L-ascorbate metabolism protein UlaG (beta-lactamase superfamily)